MAYNKYVAPSFESRAFTCPHCDVFSNFEWQQLYRAKGEFSPTYIYIAFCSHCDKFTIWLKFNGMMIWPQDISAAPLPNPDMPEDIQADYIEARSISATSPRGAAALLRLCIQKLCRHLGELGKDINTDIASLVKKGLPIQIQKALDIVRVTGNNAVHPGEMQLQEDPKTVSLIFELVNLIVEHQISQPKAVEEMYGKLPQGAVDAIKKRDGNTNAGTSSSGEV
ncbi:MAG: hypothetical protein CVT49_11060 [candidate division Zixibacteria bacterium HGW-Zixibacteria-1]|nr:MAG: hypothetical protein CVT49_11060 [candidate division Zixibacteria bacterium HGW-Zixibacteria-1]